MAYSYIPAGIFHPSHGGLGAYVRYHKPKLGGIVVKQMAPGYIWLDTPDRELLLTANTHHKQSVVPTQFDEFVNLSLSHADSSVDLDFDMYMTNYTQHKGKKVGNPEIRRTVGRKEGQPIIVADSGGFQIAVGRETWIDPSDLTQWYNKNVDLGMVLDIPIRFQDNDLVKRCAYVQKANTDFMLREKSNNLELINIFHGINDADVTAYRDICEVDGVDRLAIGGAYWFGALGAIDRVLFYILNGKKYKHYHILGVMNILHVVLYMRIASKGFAPLITSDSSTHLQNAVTKGYLFQPFISHQFKPIDIGDKENFPAPHNHLPCVCPVCSTIKYADVLRILSGNLAAFLLMTHNMYVTNRYLKGMHSIIQTATTRELKELMGFQFKSRNQFVADETLRGLDFIDLVQQEGLETARSRYAFYMKGLKIAPVAPNKLLDNAGNSFSRDNEMLVDKQSQAEYIQRISKVVEAYERYHKITP